MIHIHAVNRIVNTIALAAVTSVSAACGGGGAAVGPASTPATSTDGAATPPPPSTTVPAANAVTTVGTSFSPASITIATGSTVVWQIAGATHNVTFGANKPTGGDVGDTAPGNSASRTFPAAGTFSYQCTRHSGMTGQVVVQDGGTSTTPPTTPAPTQGIVIQSLRDRFTPEDLSITPGVTVTWEFVTGGGIVFKDRAPGGGNIAPGAPGTKVSRTFADVGDYDYYSTQDRNIKGRVRVK